ncbi:hypothetical protein C8J57DRAFT_1234089 [Mycena rebaudengoi]|nr:hypothetical protein C8J57DRAFT_1234089 [Mycena rebaudengoi]
MAIKADHHESEPTIQHLEPYDHLRRMFRICVVHNFRNIKKCAVPGEVRWWMRSLACIEHDDWDGTLLKIREKGGKAGEVWVNNKQSGKFFFAGSCWERSFIPLDIWNAGDPTSNVVETVHRDVNREGIHRTLFGGLKTGQLFDASKIKTLTTYEEYGITPSYKMGHARAAGSQHRVLSAEQQLLDENRPEKQKIEEELEKKQRAEERARKCFEKQQEKRSLLYEGDRERHALSSQRDYTANGHPRGLQLDAMWLIHSADSWVQHPGSWSPAQFSMGPAWTQFRLNSS